MMQLPLGPLMIDIAGTGLTDLDRERLRHPLVGGIIHAVAQAPWTALLERQPGVRRVWPYDRHKDAAARAQAPEWKVLPFSQGTSQGGATFAAQPDGLEGCLMTNSATELAALIAPDPNGENRKFTLSLVISFSASLRVSFAFGAVVRIQRSPSRSPSADCWPNGGR